MNIHLRKFSIYIIMYACVVISKFIPKFKPRIKTIEHGRQRSEQTKAYVGREKENRPMARRTAWRIEYHRLEVVFKYNTTVPPDIGSDCGIVGFI